MKGGESMKRYWEYMKEYQEKTKNTKAGDRIAIPEIWIGFKFLDDNGIDKPWQPEEKEKLKKVLNRYAPAERTLFVRAIQGTFDAVMRKE